MLKFGLTQYTLDHFFNKVVEQYADRPSLALVGEMPFTYAEFGEKVRNLQQVLRQLNLKKQDRVVILGTSSPNWAIAFMAVTTMGAVAVPVLDEFPETDINHIIRHSDATAIFISENLYQNLNLPVLERLNIIIKLNDFSLLSEKPQAKGKPTVWKQIQDLPELVIKSFDRSAHNAAPEAAEEPILEDDLAEILYTSGTTGHSKGVMLTHKNLVSNLFEGPDLLGVIDTHSVVLSILPLAHAFGSTSAFLSIIYCGASIYYLTKKPSPKILLQAMQSVQPTILGAVPLVFEKIYHKQVLPIINKNIFLRLLVKRPLTRRLLYRLIGRKILRLLGGNLACAIIGGASFPAEVETFLKEARIPYCCGYGMSECAPLITFSSMKTQKAGSPGHAISVMEVKIVDADPQTRVGEIYVKGPCVMKGYYKNEAETAKAFTPDGWLITGDRGYLDKDGYLFITGRSKNVIIGPSGENIYPEVIEAKLKESLFVEETLVYQVGGQLVARVYPDYAYLEGHKAKGTELAITDVLENLRRDVNTKLPAFSQIGQIIEQSSPFITTPTNKIKRVEYVPGYFDKTIAPTN